MSGDDFTLDINNPNDPKILAWGEQSRQAKTFTERLWGLYTPGLSLHKQERPAFQIGHHRRVADNLLQGTLTTFDAITAVKQQGRRAAVSFQDFFTAEEGLRGQGGRRRDEHAGNIFLGQVVETASRHSLGTVRYVLQKRQSMTLSRSDKSTSISSTRLDSLDPGLEDPDASRREMFVAGLADNSLTNGRGSRRFSIKACRGLFRFQPASQRSKLVRLTPKGSSLHASASTASRRRRLPPCARCPRTTARPFFA